MLRVESEGLASFFKEQCLSYLDEKKWVMIIAKEMYVSLLLVNKILNSITSHLDPFK